MEYTLSWHTAIPNEVNVVRGASGDLLFIRENFDLLSGVATRGISGLLNASGTGAPASGDVVSFHSVASGWLTSGLRLDTNLRDVLVTTATSGQALTYSGTFPAGKWIASTPVQTISGLTDVQMNPPTPLSGQALVYSGTHPTGKWTPSGIQINALNDIGDVVAPSPASGDFLRWTGSAWVNSGADSVPQIALRLSGTGSLTVSGNTENRLILQEMAFNSEPGFSFDLTSGHIIVSGGVSRVDIFGQIATSSDASSSSVWAGFYINEAAISGVSGWGLAVSGSRWPSDTVRASVQVAAHGVPVTSGDRISLVARDDSATSGTVSGVGTWLHVRKAAEVGAGAGGSSFVDPVEMPFPDMPPQAASGHAMDNAFEDFTSTSDPLPTNWALWDPAPIPATASGDNRFGAIRIQSAAAVSNWAGVYQAISGVGTPISGTSWSVYGRIAVPNIARGTADMNLGLAIFEDAAGAPTTTNFVAITLRLSTTDAVVDLKEYTVHSDIVGTGGASFNAGAGLFGPTSYYFRLRHTTANAIFGAISTDGFTWHEINTTVTPSWNPVHVGFVYLRRAGTGTINQQCQFFRAFSGGTNPLIPMPMGRVKLERVGTHIGSP